MHFPIEEKKSGGFSLPKWVRLAVAAALILGIAIAYLYITVRAEYAAKERVADMVMTGRGAARAVDEFMAKNGHIPSPLTQTGFVFESRYVDSIELKGNNMTVTANFAPLTGMRLVLTRRMDGNDQTAWVCRSLDIAPGLLPSHCR